MKKYLLVFLLFTTNCLLAQVKKPKETPPMIQARIYLNKTGPDYNPVKGFEIFKKCAEEGNARAMNILAVLYSDGTGTKKDLAAALEWFERSAKGGYDEAFFNLGNLYRTGWGVEQDFKKAYRWFEKGVAANSSACMYEQGYMLYKGLGVQQNYEQAIVLFKKGIKAGSLGSRYMLGLCYRNGYGIAQNADSARACLLYAAAKGYKFAGEEMAESIPEVIPASKLNVQKPAQGASVSSVKPVSYATFQHIKHTAKTADIAGEYSGFVIRYDWSGKHIIGKTPLKLTLTADDAQIAGNWKEEGGVSASLQASLADTALVFSNSSYQAADHYSAGKPVKYLFKNASLQVIKDKDSVYLAGNLQLWSVTRNEPEKPVYISLVKNNVSEQTTAVQPPIAGQLVVEELVIYPNPFENSLQVSFNLTRQANVTVNLFDLKGKQVYAGRSQLLETGRQNILLQPQLTQGVYILKVTGDNQTKSTLIIKQ